MDYHDLLEYCITDGEKEKIEAIIKHGSSRKAAAAIGRNRRTVDKAVKKIQERAFAESARPVAPGMLPLQPEGHEIKGVSSLVKIMDDRGEPVLQWVKTNKTAAQLMHATNTAIEALAQDIRPEKKVKLRNRKTLADDLLNVYIITDYHIGMKAWGQETGADWDTPIAEDMLVNWFKYAIDAAPNSYGAILANLGDFLHWDGLDAVTPSSGHILDADTRFQRLIQVAIRVIRRIIRMLLEKHGTVHVIMAEGNHDLASSGWLRILLQHLYEDETRVTVDARPDPYYCYEFGSTSVFFHHGHKRTPKNIDDVMVAKFREVFGRTKHSFCHMGHFHYNQMLETNLMQVEQHRTLAAPDAYASRGGFMSGRDAKVITYHKEYGEVTRQVISPELALAGVNV